MRTPKTLASLLISTLAALGACGGSNPAGPEATPAPEVSAYAPLSCPEKATYREAKTPQGVEQICEESGVKNGPFKRWYNEDLRAVDGSYFYGQTHEDWVWWYENGNKKSKGSYKKGKQTGSWTWWYENGEKAEEGDFLAGRKAGTWTRYYDTGVKKDEGMFHNGVKNGKWEYFRNTPENTVKKRENWQTGGLVEETFLDLAGKKIDEPLPEDIEPVAPPEAPPEEAAPEGEDDAPAEEEGEAEGSPAPE